MIGKRIAQTLNVVRWTFLFMAAIILFLSCSSSKRFQPHSNAMKTDTFLEGILRQYPQYFDTILKNRDAFRVQIIYTRIDRKKSNKPAFKHHYFNLNSKQYFYPASTIKMPIALLALQKLQKLKKYGVDRNSAMITEADYTGQTPVYNDPTTIDGRPTIEHYIKKIFLVSDNNASNRLYEFLGQEYLNKQLQKKGYSSAEIIHRLSVSLSEEENRHTNPVKFLTDTGSVAYEQMGQTSSLTLKHRKVFLGNGYVSDNKVVMEPFDFSRKNLIALGDLHLMLQSIIFPSSVSKRHRFRIPDADRNLVLKYMSQYPSETAFPPYDSSTYWDGYCKFLLWGSDKHPLPKHIRVFNKVGNAYGFLTDLAYVADFEKSIEFMLSATIYCNGDGIFNDDKYDYETLGHPFMKRLGEVIYEYETKRYRRHLPDLTEFKINR
jgi:hypothetical protein